VAVAENGRISFNLLQYHLSKAQALLFYAFDVLICRGESLLNVPIEERRKLLGGIFEKLGGEASPIKLSETIDAKPAELVCVAKEFGFEVILAKRLSGWHTAVKNAL
jgi:ATP-dependent DNA ligase